MYFRLTSLILFLFAAVQSSCNAPADTAPEVASETVVTSPTAEPHFSLGQWSFNRDLFAGDMTTFDFVAIAGELGFEGVEYVNQFFRDKAEDIAFLDSLRTAAEAAGVANVMILIDGAGNLGAADMDERNAAIGAHLKWVRAAKHLGAPAIRVNAHGDGTPEELKAACLDGIGRLAAAAQKEGIRIIIENHGGISNNGAWLADLVAQLQSYDVGSLADFDNWCTERENGRLWGAPCTNRYNRYQGMLELLPWAYSVSVKTFNFDAEGNESSMDYPTLFDILHSRDYQGYLGIEYEGDGLPSREGVVKTLALAKRSWARKPVIDAAARQRLDATLQRFVEEVGMAGVSALVWEKGEEVYFGAVGAADREAGTPIARNTIAQIYSMTKPVTGTALMQLWEQGRFKLDDPVGKYIPELAGMQVYAGVDAKGNIRTVLPRRPMTIRDLTRHTAGFYTGGDVPALKALWEASGVRNPDHTLTQLAEQLATIPLLFHPGKQWEYGPSVDVQALLVERISGQPYGEYVREHVLDPLGMHETRYFVPEEDRPRMSGAYQRSASGELRQLPAAEAHTFNINPQVFTPGGYGLTSTLDDYMRLARMLVNEGTLDGVKILEPETVRLMATNHLSDSVTERIWLPSKGQVGFGIDFAVRMRPPASPEENPGRVGEFFWDGAASTLFWVDPANELTAVFFVQLFPYDPVGLHHDFRAAVYGPFREVGE